MKADRQTSVFAAAVNFYFSQLGNISWEVLFKKKNARESSVQTELLLLVRVKWDATMGANQIRLVRDKVK